MTVIYGAVRPQQPRPDAPERGAPAKGEAGCRDDGRAGARAAGLPVGRPQLRRQDGLGRTIFCELAAAALCLTFTRSVSPEPCHDNSHGYATTSPAMVD